MSKKTIKQRIALVAVSALTAGLFSVVSAPVANAAAADMIVGANAGAVAINATDTNNFSFGVVSTAAAITVAAAATPSTAVMYDSGTLAVHSDDDGTTAVESVVVTGGTITSFTGCVLTGLTMCGSATAADFAIAVKPNAAGTLLVIRSYTGGTTSSITGATIKDQINVTVTTAATAGSFSASNSRVQALLLANAAAGAVTSNADAATASYVPNGSAGIVAFSLNDANALPMSTSTVISAAATNGAVVSFSGAGYSTSVSTTYPGTHGNIYVAQGVANAPVTSTQVSLTVNGVLYATKSFKLVGDVASIVLSKPKIGLAGAANAAGFALEVKDSAGNLISGITPSASASSINVSVISVTPAASVNNDTAAQAYNCSAVRGPSTITYSSTNAANVRITSNALPVVCAGNPHKYTASLDKASYTQGAIATLTISATDVDGKPVSDYSLVGTTANPLSITLGSQMTVVTAPVNNSDVFTSGVKTYKYGAGTTAGSYNGVVDLTAWNDSATPQAAITVPFIITGDGSVSNADVLKSIVALIASINKQIAALQKLILARK